MSIANDAFPVVASGLRIGRTRADSLFERRVKALLRLSAALRPRRVTSRSRRLQSVEDRPYPSGHRPLAGPSLTVKPCGSVLEC